MRDPSGQCYGRAMTGIRTSCKNETATGRIGCGATYSGRMLHCVAPAAWSSHPDGLCHETFSAESSCDLHLGFDGATNTLRHDDPRTIAKLGENDRGVWRSVDRSDRPNPWANRAPGSRPVAPPEN